MRLSLVLALLVIASVLAGCSGKEDGGETPTSSSSSSTAPPPVELANRPPVANLTASLVQGSVPFNVTFNMTGSDPDGDSLTWTLDADGDNATEQEGTSLPANLTFSYATPGLYNVTFRVSDGQANATTTLSINATAAAPAAAPLEEFRCTVDFPTAGFSSQSPAGNFGACTFTNTDAPTILATAAPASGCVITFDDNPDDNFGGADASVGTEYPAGGQYDMECQLPDSTTGGEGVIGLQVLSA